MSATEAPSTVLARIEADLRALACPEWGVVPSARRLSREAGRPDRRPYVRALMAAVTFEQWFAVEVVGVGERLSAEALEAALDRVGEWPS